MPSQYQALEQCSRRYITVSCKRGRTSERLSLISTPDLKVVAYQQVTVQYGHYYRNEALDILFPFAMENPVHFESMIALVRQTFVKTQGGQPALDSAFLYHRGKTLSRLRKRLMEHHNQPDEACALATATMLVTDVSSARH